MSLWDSVQNVLTGGGYNAVNKGYNQANDRLNPYARGGMDSYNNLRTNANNAGATLNNYGNPADWMYKQINQSPMDYYNSIMGGYNESPEAHQAQERAYNASTRGASASGMLGSGAQLKGLQSSANDISQLDRQQYYNNVMGANQAQMGYLNNFQDQQTQYRNMMQYLAQLGYGAASGIGQNNINRGNAHNEMGRQSVGDILSATGFGSGNGGLFGSGGGGGNQSGYGMNFGSGGGAGNDIPEYALKAMMMGGM